MNACEQNGYTVDPEVVKIFTEYRKLTIRAFLTLTHLR